jgi:hypothetical protein
VITYLACVPVDINDALPADVPRWAPSIEHTLTQCQVCDRDMWMGPKQVAFLAASPQSPLLCMHCAVMLNDLTGIPVEHLGGVKGIPRVQ